MQKKSVSKLASCLIVVGSLFLACSTTETKVVDNNQHPNVVKLMGTNVGGCEIDWKGEGVNVVSGTHYQCITHQDIDYLVSKGINTIRLNMSWEYLQPSLNVDFPPSEYNLKFTDVVNYATSKNLFVIIEPHGGSDINFWKYKGNLVGSPQVPISAFTNFWKFMALKFKNNDNVIYGFGNEPHDMSTATLYLAQQAGIDTIRATGSRQMILTQLNHFSHAWTMYEKWTDSLKQMTNAQGMLTLKDPLNNIVFEIHEYYGNFGSGTSTFVESATATVDRLRVGVNYARAHNLKLLLGETGASETNPLSKVAVQNVYDYVNANSDVIIGALWWNYGVSSWWANYQFTLSTTNNFTTENVKWQWITPYFKNVRTLSPTLPLVAAPVDAGALDAGQDASTPNLVVAIRRTSNFGVSACYELDLKNNTQSSLSWISVRIDLGDGLIQRFWQATTTTTKGVVEFKAPEWNRAVKPQSKNTFGWCQGTPSTIQPKVVDVR